jgi:hypothetical protein
MEVLGHSMMDRSGHGVSGWKRRPTELGRQTRSHDDSIRSADDFYPTRFGRPTIRPIRSADDVTGVFLSADRIRAVRVWLWRCVSVGRPNRVPARVVGVPTRPISCLSTECARHVSLKVPGRRPIPRLPNALGACRWGVHSPVCLWADRFVRVARSVCTNRSVKEGRDASMYWKGSL